MLPREETKDYKEDSLLILNDAANHFWYSHRNKIIGDLVAKSNIKTPPNIIELGAGSGNISMYLTAKGYNVTASEFYQLGINLIESKGIKAFQYSLTDNNLPPEEHLKRYDIAILGDVIEHLDNPAQALSKVRYFLKTNGKIVVTVPASKMLWSQYDRSHKRRYSIKLLRRHLYEAGFIPIQVRYFMFLPGVILLITRKVKEWIFDNPDFSNELKISPLNNSIMRTFMKIEYYLQKALYIPFGSSIYALAEMKTEYS